MICLSCKNTGLIWVKMNGADAVGKCPCPEGSRDPRVFPVLTPGRIKVFEVREAVYQKSKADDKLVDEKLKLTYSGEPNKSTESN